MIAAADIETHRGSDYIGKESLKIGHTGNLNTNFSLRKRPLANRKDINYLCAAWTYLLSNERTGVSKREKN